jgi:excisionase family DNA binding protein
MTKSKIYEGQPLIVGMSKAAVLLDCSRDRIYQMLRAGELRSYLERNRRKILMSSIEELVAKRLAAAGHEFRITEKSNLPNRRKAAA